MFTDDSLQQIERNFNNMKYDEIMTSSDGLQPRDYLRALNNSLYKYCGIND